MSGHGLAGDAPLTCADCGKRMHRTVNSLPQGEARCHECRRHSKTVVVRCQECGVDVSGANRRFCSVGCHNKNINNSRRVYGDTHRSSGGGSARTRARRWGLVYQRIDQAKIYKRDKWTCQLCMAPIPKDAKHPDPLSATVDHIVPMSCGGGHLPSNVQLAHLGCNTSKGNRGSYQLAMSLTGMDLPSSVRAKKVKTSREPMTCSPCGGTFTPYGKQRYCSADCSLEWNGRQIRERYRARVGLPPTWDRPLKKHVA